MNIRDHPFLWQWDRNRALFVNEPGALYVDFVRPGETPDRRKVVDGIAEISDTWLQKAWLYYIRRLPRRMGRMLYQSSGGR